MSKNIFVPQPIAKESIDFLQSKGYNVYSGSGDLSKNGIINDIKKADALILRTLKIDKEIIESAKNLKIVARHGAGYDNLDFVACKKNGVYSTFSPNSTTLSVAEFAIASIMTLSKRFKEFEQMVRTDSFNDKFNTKGSDVYGKTLGIIGFGKIGQLVAKKASLGLDMKVLILDRGQKELPEYVEAVDMDTLLSQSDFITLHVPGGNKSKNLLSFEQFDIMKKSAFIINASRGGVMNEEAFVEAVKNKKISGGVIDVFNVEPPNLKDEIFSLENVIVTPHIGSNTTECMIRIAMDCAVDIDRVFLGEEPLYPII